VVFGADARFCNYIGHEYVSPEILLGCNGKLILTRIEERGTDHGRNKVPRLRRILAAPAIPLRSG
jgi:hypothetical protein